MAFGGSSLIAQAERDVATVNDRQASFANDPSQSLEGIDDARTNAEASAGAANGLGTPLVVGGIGLASAGLVGLGVGLYFAFTSTEIDGGAL